MKVDELFSNDPLIATIRSVAHRLTQFTAESKALPLLKNLPKAYTGVHKVKVRFKKPTDFSQTFNHAFEDVSQLHQRAIFANGSSSFKRSPDPEQEPYYILPVNGYKFMYCMEISQSNIEYKQVFDALFEQFGNDKGQAVAVISDLLKYNYIKENLHEGLATDAEIVLYGIPHYYAVKCALVNDYAELYNALL
jgi:hypothetical protein